ncbi:MAG: MMPL family transporter [Myxococcota bacterium]
MSSGDAPGARSESTWRAAVEAGFARWGRIVVRHRWLALVLSVAMTGWLVSHLPQLEIDNSTESFLTTDAPNVVLYNAFREQFGRDDKIVVAVEGGDLFSLPFLERLRDLHEALENDVPYVTEVESLVNARFTRGEAGELVVGELLEEWPETAEALAVFEERVRSNPLYQNALVSSDYRVTAIAVTPDTYSSEAPQVDELGGFGEGGEGSEGAADDEAPVYMKPGEGDAVIESIYAVLDRFQADDFRLHMAGALPLTWRINDGMERDFSIFIPTTLGLMGLVLGLLFRRVGGVVLPLMVVGLSLAAAVGVMIVLGIPGSSAVQILPVFLLTVGVCDAVHVLAIVYRYRMEGMDKEEAIVQALAHSGLAILMTSVTTAAGMVSFITSEMAAVQDLGILAPIGVLLAFVYTVVLLPALLAVFPLPAPKRGRIAQGLFPFESFLVSAGRFAVRAPWRVLVPTAGIVSIAVLGAVQITFSHNGLKWFPEDDRTRVDFEAIDRFLGGSVTLDVLVDTGEPGGLYDPDLLRALERIEFDVANLAQDPIVVADAVSIREIVEETHQALNENRPEMRRVPDSRNAVAQELLLFEQSGSDDTEELVDSEFRVTRLNMRIPFVDALLYPDFLAEAEQVIAARLDGRATFQITGLMTLLADIFDAVIVSMSRSYVFAFCVITPLMMLLLGSLRRGLVSMVPNLLPIVAVLAVMGWGRIAIDTTTMMVGAMVIGIAVDDTIHFMHKFQGYFEQSANLELAVTETLRTTGSALLFTTFVLIAGFSVFGLSEMSNMRVFGLLSAFAAGVALLADVFVAPALLAVVEGARARKLAARAAGA